MAAASASMCSPRRCSITAEEYRSSTSTVSTPKRPCSWLAKRRQRTVISCSAPSGWAGRPTMQRVGVHSAINLPSSANLPSLVAALMMVKGWACLIRVLPIATPMRFKPKSKARSVSTESCSGPAEIAAEHDRVDAQQGQRCSEALLHRQVEDDGWIGFDGQPAVAAEFFFQLTGAPARTTQADQHLLRPVAVSDCFQHVFGGSQGNAVGHLQSRRELTHRCMQHKTTLDLHRTAEHHRAAIQLGHGVRRIVNDFELEIDAIEQDIHGHVGRLVDDDAER